MKTIKKLEKKNLRYGLSQFDSGYGRALKDVIELIDSDKKLGMSDLGIRLKQKIQGDEEGKGK